MTSQPSRPSPWEVPGRRSLPFVDTAAVIADAPEPVIVANLRGTIVLANAAATALLGVSEPDLVGQPVSDVFDSEEGAALRSAFGGPSPAPARTVYGSVRNAGGERIPVSLDAAVWHDARGRAAGVVGFVRDRRAAEREQEALERRAEALERVVEERTRGLHLAIQAKDEFLAVLSHELRTPLTPILTWAQIIRRDPDPQRVQQAAEVIERNVRLQMALVVDLLDLTRITQGTLVLDRLRHDLRAIIQAALDAVAGAAAEKQIRLEWLPPAGPVTVDADEVRLGQAFRHVLSNAVKFGRQGGRVQVTLSRDEGTAAVCIRDDGVGIQPDFLPHVFDMFRQQEAGSRRRYGGMGVGLALARRLVELHGGTIALLSEGHERGTEVSVRLPVWGATGREADDAVALAGARLDGVRILLVEDSADTGNATRLLLEALGARVALATDGWDALGVLATEEPDAILCDLRMPGLDGFELLRRLRADPRRAHLRVIAVSGFARQTDYQRTREAGFDGHVSKPFDIATIVGALRRVLRDPTAGQS